MSKGGGGNNNVDLTESLSRQGPGNAYSLPKNASGRSPLEALLGREC
jgi:hypothetical protein